MIGRRILAALIVFVFVVVAFSGSFVVAKPAPQLNIDQNYEKYVEEKLVGLGTWPGYGFRAAGSSSENAGAAFIKQEMVKIGLSNVRMERVPVDAWEFKGASLTVSGASGTYKFLASSMGGVPGTPPAGLTGEIVYVGQGTPGEYPATGVQGKLLLCDWNADNFWVNLIGKQATIDGAKGVIISTMNYPVYYEWPSSLGSFDATYDDSLVPLIVISRNDGFSLMGMMANGPVIGTMVSNVKLTLAEDGGSGYNVVGVYPGRNHQNPILILGHHDAWFFGASDDTSAIPGLLAWAKALKKMGFVPEHDLYFIATTGEEYGNTDAYYEWLVGSWYMITQAHPDWAMEAVAFLNIEGIGGRWFDGSTGPFTARANYQLAPLARAVFGANPALLPNGWEVTTELSSWQDGWPLTAAGIPGITFSDTIPGYDAIYHTNMDNLGLIHYDDMAMQVKVMHKFLEAIDSAKILPFMFMERAVDLTKSYNANDFAYVGVDASGLGPAISEFKSLARKYDAAASKLTAGDADAANALLTEASQLINREWTALSCWDSVIYPTQQVEWDAIWLTNALGYLKDGNLHDACDELWNVGLTWNAFFDKEVFEWENDRHAPDAPHLNWGAQGHLAPYVDIYDAYVSLRQKEEVQSPDISWEKAALETVLASEKTVLQDRIDVETLQIMQVNSVLAQLIQLATT
ncbi:MAG: hypothetical protein C4K47_05320 [Candidatus Thorarchaeota archaeon]|nr:MAG: hypothetical protein C4K47_05320 [Candidatus Thorarchaeota archaeon]